jgi:hypothetical protein
MANTEAASADDVLPPLGGDPPLLRYHPTPTAVAPRADLPMSIQIPFLEVDEAAPK